MDSINKMKILLIYTLIKKGLMIMKEVKAYLCQVDCYRNGTLFRDKSNRLYDRQTRGSYIVGAKTAKEARQLLQEKIGFGSIHVCDRESTMEYIATKVPHIEYKQIIRFHPKEEPVRHATAALQKG